MTLAETNDAHRKILSQEGWLKRAGRFSVIFTSGVLACAQTTDDILLAVASFDNFNQESDPDGEHVFGQINVNGVDMVWHIEYLAGGRMAPSPNKFDENVTIRVLTVMLRSEYENLD